MQNFALKFQAVAEKTAKKIRGLLYFAAPCRSLSSTENVQKWGVVAGWFFLAKSAGRCFTPVMEIKCNRVSLRGNFYADIQLIRGRFWLQLWTLKKYSEPRVSWKYLAKMRENCETPFAATSMGVAYWVIRRTALCNLLRVSIYNLVYNGRRRRRQACLRDFKDIFLVLDRLLCVFVS